MDSSFFLVLYFLRITVSSFTCKFDTDMRTDYAVSFVILVSCNRICALFQAILKTNQ